MKKQHNKYIMRVIAARLSVIVALAVLSVAAMGQTNRGATRHDHSHTDGTGKKVAVAPSYAWKVLSPLGLREETGIDTLFQNYAQEFVPSEVSPAWATTGNLGAEGINMIFHERKPISDFFFADALAHWTPALAKMKFYNTRIPMTLVSFNTGGGRTNAQERLQATFSGNVNAKLQIGAMLDYLYSKGSYEYQATKDLSWGFSGSYIGDRYEFQGFYNHWNLLNKESGGITDMLYITDPAVVQGGVTSIDPKSIPTNLRDAHTRLVGEELFLNNRYKVGYWHEEFEGDSVVSREYIPVSSFIYTLHYSGGKHIFRDASPNETREFFTNTYLNPDITYDRTTYWKLDNTLGVSLLEGFHKYAKFGLAAYLTHQVRHYVMPLDTLDRSAFESLTPFPEGVNVAPSKTEQLAWVGARLTKQRGSLLTYDATAELGLLGPAAGEIKVEGNVNTRFPLLGDSLSIAAFGAFRNESAPYLMNNYISNHFMWQNSFGKQRTVTFGGQLNFGKTGTNFRASVSNLQNYLYFGADGLPRQHGGSVQVLSLTLKQALKVGILHWDNDITYQATGNDAVIPLPALSVYSNLYLLFRIATLRVQLGVDCDWYTRYYAPGYQPATASFVNQREMKLGNYPFCNAYANMKLGKVRFYVLFSHVNQGLFGGSNYFSAPYYPLNPRRFQLGLSVDFAN